MRAALPELARRRRREWIRVAPAGIRLYRNNLSTFFVSLSELFGVAPVRDGGLNGPLWYGQRATYYSSKPTSFEPGVHLIAKEWNANVPSRQAKNQGRANVACR